jgi:Ca2+ transporting ATPase
MSTILTSITDNSNGYDKRIHMKGASEIVLGNCTKWMNANGQICDLDDPMKQQILKIIEDYAKQALRTICLAYKDLKAGEGGPSHEEVSDNEELKRHNVRKIEETGFICFAILGIKDVIRPEVPLAVKQCKAASIKVRMVTGDNKITAKAIAKECNIYEDGIPDDLQVMEGPAFYEKVGGLYCKNCTKPTPCQCAAKDVKEGVRLMTEFR